MKMGRTVFQTTLVTILVLALIVLVGWRLYRVTRPLPLPQATPPLVEFQTLNAQDLELWVDYVGTVEARRRASVSTLVGGRLAELPRREGETVAKDELLIRLDQLELRAERDRLAEALAGDEA
ncbi:MAG TPA: hypothetical protein ENN98_02360, partial [Desulfurivibrio alkaliphilus]|nr:hypothetical protein [Desulfurivibrio alkaliphilus]